MTRATFAALLLCACATHEVHETTVEPLPPSPVGPPVASATLVQPPVTPPVDVRPDGLEIEDVRVGTGAELRDGGTAVVHYVGTLTDGTEFDSSRARKTPFTIAIPGPVIKGWNEGLPGMRVGGLRRLTIPGPLAYGSRAIGKIPADATLVFEIELLEVR